MQVIAISFERLCNSRTVALLFVITIVFLYNSYICNNCTLFTYVTLSAAALGFA